LATDFFSRILGVAHVEDLECISNKELRASSEKKVLTTAKKMLTEAKAFTTIASIIELIKTC
jgi:5-methylthioribose kinase